MLQLRHQRGEAASFLLDVVARFRHLPGHVVAQAVALLQQRCDRLGQSAVGGAAALRQVTTDTLLHQNPDLVEELGRCVDMADEEAVKQQPRRQQYQHRHEDRDGDPRQQHRPDKLTLRRLEREP